MIRDRTATVGIAVGVAMLVAAALQFSGGYYALAAGILGGCRRDRCGCAAHARSAPSRPAFESLRRCSSPWVRGRSSRPDGVGCRRSPGGFAGLMLAGCLGSDRRIGARSACSRRCRRSPRWDHGARGESFSPRLGRDPLRPDWFRVRQLEGPIGYHNGEATIFAMGVPLALWVATSTATLAAGSRRGGCSALSLDRSPDPVPRIARGDRFRRPAAAGDSSRRARLAALALLLAAASAPLFLALRTVDRALIDGRPLDDPAFRNYVLLALLLALVVGALSLPSLPPMPVDAATGVRARRCGGRVRRSSRLRSGPTFSPRTSAISADRSPPSQMSVRGRRRRHAAVQPLAHGSNRDCGRSLWR